MVLQPDKHDRPAVVADTAAAEPLRYTISPQDQAIFKPAANIIRDTNFPLQLHFTSDIYGNSFNHHYETPKPFDINDMRRHPTGHGHDTAFGGNGYNGNWNNYWNNGSWNHNGNNWNNPNSWNNGNNWNNGYGNHGWEHDGIRPGPELLWQQAKQRGFQAHRDAGGDFDQNMRENIMELKNMGYSTQDSIQMVATHQPELGAHGHGRTVKQFLNGWNPDTYQPSGSGEAPAELWADAKQRGFVMHHDSGGDFDNNLRENIVELMNMGYAPQDAMQMVSLNEEEEGGHGRSIPKFLNGWNPMRYRPY